jgi:hypothetical protein
MSFLVGKRGELLNKLDLALDYKNLSLQYGSQLRQKSTKVQRNLIAKVNNTWIDEHLEEALDVMKKGVTSLKKANKHWNIPLTFLSNHLNGKTRSRKYGPLGVLTFDEDQVHVSWILNM